MNLRISATLPEETGVKRAGKRRGEGFTLFLSAVGAAGEPRRLHTHRTPTAIETPEPALNPPTVIDPSHNLRT